MGVKAKGMQCSGFARVNKVTSASLGYPLSVFNKNSTLNEKLDYPEHGVTKCGVPSVQHQAVATRSKSLTRSTSLLADSESLCPELNMHQY